MVFNIILIILFLIPYLLPFLRLKKAAKDPNNYLHKRSMYQEAKQVPLSLQQQLFNQQLSTEQRHNILKRFKHQRLFLQVIQLALGLWILFSLPQFLASFNFVRFPLLFLTGWLCLFALFALDCLNSLALLLSYLPSPALHFTALLNLHGKPRFVYDLALALLAALALALLLAGLL